MNKVSYAAWFFLPKATKTSKMLVKHCRKKKSSSMNNEHRLTMLKTGMAMSTKALCRVRFASICFHKNFSFLCSSISRPANVCAETFLFQHLTRLWNKNQVNKFPKPFCLTLLLCIIYMCSVFARFIRFAAALWRSHLQRHRHHHIPIHTHTPIYNQYSVYNSLWVASILYL